ncbi:hypothetical protein [Nocardia sp. NPDC052112]
MKAQAFFGDRDIETRLPSTLFAEFGGIIFACASNSFVAQH